MEYKKNPDGAPRDGAPSSDGTSALFVSARKKQLAQQEAERAAREKEEQRLAAEAEVRRLEAEVVERKRRAEEEALRVEADNAEKRRLAEAEAKRIAAEANALKAQAAANPNAVLGTPPPQAPAFAAPVQPAAAAPAKPLNMKLIIGAAAGALVVLILAIVLISSIGGGGVDSDAKFDASTQVTVMAMGINYPKSQLKISSQNANGVAFGPIDQGDDVTINCVVHSVGNTTIQALNATNMEFVKALSTNIVDGKIGAADTVGSHVRRRMAGVDSDTGNAMVLYVQTGGWKNIHNNKVYTYSFLLACPQKSEDAWVKLWDRMLDELYDPSAAG
ncbi:MAG: hypothetical protein LBT74_11175 [Acidobacteriota bacterium]|jgi:hypothetical protein|nr:hypothetical protein [Acidobacteriota bacterium]